MSFMEELISTHIIREGNISSNVKRRLQCMLEISRKYYVQLKKVSKVPNIEQIQFEGRIYSTVGLKLLRKKIYKRNILFDCCAV